MADAQTGSTRIFVKGLPPSFTSEQLASHFGKQYKVTDAHVFSDRRIGFVGFHDNNSAQNAVSFFHRSYIRMSKISVDLARPVEVKRDAAGHAIPISKRNTTHFTRSQTEANQEPAQQSGELSRKRKRERKDDGEIQRSEGVANNPTEAVSDKQNASNETKEDAKEVDEEKDVAANKSDNDWLRGKTSRLLDLVEPEEVDEPDSLKSSDSQTEPEAATKSSSQKDNEEKNDSVQGLRLHVPNGRLFLRNLAFDVTDADLQDRFGQFGKLQEAHVVRDPRTSSSKGLAFLQFSQPNAAEDAFESLDGVPFHGRLLHILPASDKRDQGLTDYDISKMPLKKQKAIRRKMEAGTATFSWNSLYMNPDAVITSIADRLGVSKSQILDPTSSDAAVKQAHAETQLLAETKEYLRTHGVSIDAFKNKQRDDRIVLLKNFPFGTSESELRALLEPFGQISRFVFPPAGIMALAQFTEPYSASQALKQLAYKNIKGSVLYLEKAPKGLLDEKALLSLAGSKQDSSGNPQNTVEDHVVSAGNMVTLFVRNLNFTTTTTRLTEVFGTLPGFVSARVKTRVDPKRPDEILSMGFGFVEFQNKTFGDTAVSALNGHRLDGHQLIVQHSRKDSDIAEERRNEDNAKKGDATRTKIIIKNLPFQASKKDVKSLFAQYGQLKTVRVPKKFDNTSRGFGFAEFVTAKEAQSAMDALADTHLLGRRLVLEFAEEEEIDPEEQIQAMERKMEQQSNRIHLSKLTGTGRKRFIVGADEQDA